jgi:hypothetical protein
VTLCDPQVIFYCDGYEIIHNTWESQGTITKCQCSQRRSLPLVCCVLIVAGV